MSEWGRSKLRLPSRVRMRGDREAWERHLAENEGLKLTPQPATEAKALAVRQQRQQEMEMAQYKDKKTRRKMTKAAKVRVEKQLAFSRPKPAENGPFRASKSIKHAMELLDDTFKYLKQKPPIMNTSLAEPWTAFLVDAHAKIEKWPEAVLKQFVEELTPLTPKGIDATIKVCKQIMDYTFNAPSNKTGPKYNARWKMWPHQRDREEVEATNDKENLMSKLAAKKKVSSKKGDGKAAKAKGPAKERAGGLLLFRANTKLPDGSDRQKKAVEAVGKAGVLLKDHAKKHGRMIVRACIKNGFLKTKKAA